MSPTGHLLFAPTTINIVNRFNLILCHSVNGLVFDKFAVQYFNMYVPFAELSDTSRVWVYAADRPLSPGEQSTIQQQAQSFAESWTAHQQNLKASFAILHNLFLVLAVDESHHGASGCSIDKSVAFMKQLQQQLGIDFFNRMQIELAQNGEPRIVSRQEALQLAAQPDIFFFDKTITNIHELHTRFVKTVDTAWFYKPQTA